MGVNRTTIALQTCVGLGLLLVIATEQKLCAWPVVEIKPATETQQDGQSPKRKQAPITVGSTLPVTAPPRWAAESREQFDASRWLDALALPLVGGVGGRFAESIATAAAPWRVIEDALAAMRARRPDRRMTALSMDETTPADNHYRTAISPTGPPIA